MVKSLSKQDKNKNITSKTKQPSINLNADINDSEWKCIVVLAMESNVSGSDFITFFQEEAKKNIRPVIKGLTFEALIQSVKKGKAADKKGSVRDKSKDSKGSKSSGKSKTSSSAKSGEKSILSPKSHEDDYVTLVLAGLKKGQIPSEPLAKLVKKYILNLKQADIELMKQADIERKKALELLEKEAKHVEGSPSRKSKQGMVNDEIKLPKDKKGEKNDKTKKGSKGKDPNKKEKKGAKNKEKTGKSGKKVLEINDHPVSGPNIYIVLSGFYDPDLLTEMVKIGIPIRSIVVVDSQTEENVQKTDVIDDIDKTTVKTKKDKKPDQSKKIEKILKFWDEIKNVLNNPVNKLLSKDLSTIRISPSVNFKSCEQKKDKMSAAYNELSFIMYKIYDYWKKYETYINNMIIFKVANEHILAIENANLYNAKIDLVPLECCTVEIILHCMLEQVLWWGEQKEENIQIESTTETKQQVEDEYLLKKESRGSEQEEENKRSTDTKDEMSQKDLIMSKTPSEVKNIYSVSEDSVSEGCSKIVQFNDETSTELKRIDNLTPILLDSYDFFKTKTFHLLNIPGLNIDEISDMFLNSAITLLWHRYPVQTEFQQKLYKYHLQNFKRNCDAFYYDSDYIFNIYLHQTLLQRMMSTHFGLITDHQLKSDNLYFNDDVRTISLDCGEVLEELMPKVVVDVETSLHDVDIEVVKKNGKVDEASLDQDQSVNRLYSGFLTSSEKHNIREKDMKYLKSFLECTELRNLYEDMEDLNNLFHQNFNQNHIKELSFIKEMDSKTLAQTLQVSFRNYRDVLYNYSSLTDCIIVWLHQSHDFNYINYGKSEYKLNTLIGFKDFCELILFQEETLLHKIENKNKTKEINTDVIVDDKRDIVSNKCEEQNLVSSESPIHHIKDSEVVNENMENVDIGNKMNCYDLGSFYISFKESVTDFYSPRGIHIQLNKTKGFKESTLLQVKIDSSGNIFNIYQNLPITESKSKIYFTTYNDIIISTDLKLLYSSNNLNENENENENEPTESAQSPTKTDVPNEVDGLVKEFETDSGIQIVLPTGLQIDIIRTASEVGPFYVRQKYMYKNWTLSKIMDEDYRCYLRNGCILIFKTDQTVEILYNNSTIVKCTNLQFVAPPQSEPEKVVEPEIEVKDLNKRKRSRSKDKSKKSEPGMERKRSSSKSKNKKDTKNESKKERISKKNKEKGKKEKSPKRKSKLKEVEEIPPPPPPPPVLKMDKAIISALGECFQVENDVLESSDTFYTLRTAYDYQNYELYTHRSDGTDCLLTNYNLNVHFADGSQIKTSCEEDNNVYDPISVSSNEIINVKEFIELIYQKQLENDGSFEDILCKQAEDITESNNSEQNEVVLNNVEEEDGIGNTESVQNGGDNVLEVFDNINIENIIGNTDEVLNGEENLQEIYFTIIEDDIESTNDEQNILTIIEQTINKIKLENLEDEEFDILTMDCTLEHENYATVNYVNGSNQIVLRLPGEVTLILHNDKRVEVSVGRTTDLVINQNEAVLTSTSPEFLTLDCVTIVPFLKPEINRESKEKEGLNSSRPKLLCETIDANGNLFLINEKGEAMKLQITPGTIPMNWNEVGADVFRDRCFVLRRDLSGYEIINEDHPTVFNTVTDVSVNKHRLLENTDFCKYIHQKPVTKTTSEKYLMELNKVLPLQLKRKDLTKPKIHRELWFPEIVKPTWNENYKLKPQNIIRPNYTAFTYNCVQQIKTVCEDVSRYFDEALSKYILNCTEKYNAYEKHVVKEIRAEEEVMESARLIAKVNAKFNLNSDSCCSLCKLSWGQISSFTGSSNSITNTEKDSIKSEKVINITNFEGCSLCGAVE